MNTWNDLASIGNILVGPLVLVGGYIALRSGKTRTSGQLQSQAIEALQAEVTSLNRRMQDLEKENTHLQHLLSLIKTALGKRGLLISIDGDLLTISDGHHKCSYSAIQEESH